MTWSTTGITLTVTVTSTDCGTCAGCDPPVVGPDPNDDIDAAIALIPATIASITVSGGEEATELVKAGAIKAYLDALTGMSALGVTIAVVAEMGACGVNCEKCTPDCELGVGGVPCDDDDEHEGEHADDCTDGKIIGWTVTVSKAGGADKTKAVAVTAFAEIGCPFGLEADERDFILDASAVGSATSTAALGALPAGRTLTVSDVQINLSTEALVIAGGNTPVFATAIWSINGGDKWNEGAPPASLTRILNRGATIWLADKGNRRDGPYVPPTPGAGEPALTGDAAIPAVVVQFRAIGARPAVRYAANFDLKWGTGDAEGSTVDLSGKTGGQWGVVERGETTLFGMATGTAAANRLQIGIPADGRKMAATDAWQVAALKGTGGQPNLINVQETTTPRPVRTTFFVRSAPVIPESATGEVLPGGRAIKVNASSRGKAPNVRANYKLNNVRGKGGMVIGNAVSETVGTGSAAVTTWSIDTTRTAAASSADGITYYVWTRENARENAWGFAPQLVSEGDLRFVAMSVPTARRAASAVQVINIAPANRLNDMVVPVVNGKINWGSGDTALEAARDNDKWGKVRPTEGQASIPGVRFKNTARSARTDAGFTGAAASVTGTMVLTWGENARGRPMITAARIVGPNYADGQLDLYLLSNSGINPDGELTLVYAVKGLPTKVTSAPGDPVVTEFDLDAGVDLEDYFVASLTTGTVTHDVDVEINEWTMPALAADRPALPAGLTLAGLGFIEVILSEGEDDDGDPVPVVPGNVNVAGNLFVPADPEDSSSVDTGLVGKKDGKISLVRAITTAVDLDNAAKLAVARVNVAALTFTATAADAEAAKKLVDDEIAKATTVIPDGVTVATVAAAGATGFFDVTVTLTIGAAPNLLTAPPVVFSIAITS
jgi:transposase